MRETRFAGGFTRFDLVAVLVSVIALLAAATPAIESTGRALGIQVSMRNLAVLGAAHAVYAADWSGRQVTWVRDDLGVYDGDPVAYNQAAEDCNGFPYGPDCQPPIIAGFDCQDTLWAYWPAPSAWAFQPINFPGYPNGSFVEGWGHFRLPHARPFHDYVNGRYFDRTFYAPRDRVALEAVRECLDTDCEFEPDCNTGAALFSSYCMSPAAMFHPDVFRSNAAGGWQGPWELDHGYQSPGLFTAAYPSLKTLMLEHSWLQGPPAQCNPAYAPCTPYQFNHGLGSQPVTLFYDGQVRLLSNAQVAAADQQILQQTGDVDGLWHRGTPFGDEGYRINDGDGSADLSHHILTTDGILGRDTLADE